jgi:hypothetical protein
VLLAPLDMASSKIHVARWLGATATRVRRFAPG